MTAVLAYTSPAMGHLYPMMPLLLELRDRGLDVHVRTLDTLVDQARAAGLSAERIDARLRPIADKHPDWAATNAKAALERSATMFAERAVDLQVGDRQGGSPRLAAPGPRICSRHRQA